MKRLWLVLLCWGVLSTMTGCYVAPYPYPYQYYGGYAGADVSVSIGRSWGGYGHHHHHAHHHHHKKHKHHDDHGGQFNEKAQIFHHHQHGLGNGKPVTKFDFEPKFGPQIKRNNGQLFSHNNHNSNRIPLRRQWRSPSACRLHLICPTSAEITASQVRTRTRIRS